MKPNLPMKARLLCGLLLCSLLTFGQTERHLIHKIDSINNLAINYYDADDIVSSFTLFNQAMHISDSIGDNYGSAVANFTLGKIYLFMHEFDKAESSFNKAISISENTEDNYLLASSYLNLGELFKYKYASDEVVPYYEKAISYAEKDNVRDHLNNEKGQEVLFETRLGLASLYINNDDLNKALIYLSRAEENLANQTNQSYSTSKLRLLQGKLYSKKQLYQNANVKFLEAARLLERDNTYDSEEKSALLSEVYKAISECYAKLGDDSEAYKTLLIHNEYRNAFFNAERLRQENLAKSKFSIENYKKVAIEANNQRMLQQEKSDKIRNVNIVVLATVFLLIISLLTMYKSYASKRRLSDILKERNKLLHNAKDQAVKSSELKSNFISNVTHELRTPLYGVVGITSLLLKNNDLSEKDAKFLKSLKYSGDYLLNLVNDILQIGKIESKKIKLKHITVNLRVLIENLVNSFDYRLEESNNQIQITIDKNVPEFVKCDNVRLSQVLINLVGNSIKFTENGKINVKVKLLDIVEDTVSLRFEVEDNGSGIPKEKQKLIFENFSQLDENNNTNYQGTGLGLPITKNIIELFGSTLEVESEVNVGTTFSFELNFEIDREAKIEVRETHISKGEVIASNKKYKILVAEDNKINQIVTQNLLQRENYECVIAKDGKEALEAHMDTNFDLILMDINMPIMNGNEATKAIREFDTSTPIIALTAADIEQVKEDYKVFGFDGIITKPFDNYEFFQTVSEHIERTKIIEAETIDINLKVS